VTVDDLVDRYDVTSNPAVKAGKMTRDQALREFLSNWDRLEQDGVVTLEEFEDYYKEISASIDGDDYFELMIRNAWRIAGGEGMAANTANRRVLVTNKDGSQSVVGLRNELGLRPGDRDGIRARLAEQGVDAADIELYGGIDNTTKARKVIILLYPFVIFFNFSFGNGIGCPSPRLIGHCETSLGVLVLSSASAGVHAGRRQRRGRQELEASRTVCTGSTQGSA
jgi:hypothetical protein